VNENHVNWMKLLRNKDASTSSCFRGFSRSHTNLIVNWKTSKMRNRSSPIGHQHKDAIPHYVEIGLAHRPFASENQLEKMGKTIFPTGHNSSSSHLGARGNEFRILQSLNQGNGSICHLLDLSRRRCGGVESRVIEGQTVQLEGQQHFGQIV
jgi:hypothetical protein